MILIPVLVHYKVDENTEEESPRTLIKLSVTLFAFLITVKGAQFLKSTILRKPISGNTF